MTQKITRYCIAIAFGGALITTPSLSHSNDLWPDLATPATTVGGGEHDAAVIVGAENYFKVEPVIGAKQNADDWQAYLTGVRKVPVDHVALLLDDDATADQIRQAATEKATQVGEHGTLWFVFIGHGAPSKDGKDGLLIGIDAQQKVESVYSRSVSRNDLLSVLAKGKQTKTFVLLDACFSGKTSSGRALVAGLQPLITMRNLPTGIDNRTILLTAARADQFAGPLPGGSRPAFSYLALGALRGWAADAKGVVTASAIVDYARKTLGLAHDRTQTPELSTPETGNFILANGHEQGPDLARLQRGAAASSNAFQVTELPTLPRIETPRALDSTSTGLDFRSLDADALDKYNAAFELDKSGAATAEDKADHWRKLGHDMPQYADLAAKRAAQWDAYASQRKASEQVRHQRITARDDDWIKLDHLLTLSVIPESEKSRWSDEFLKAYLKSPGIEPEMARKLVLHVPSGTTKSALTQLAKKDSEKLDTDASPRSHNTESDDQRTMYAYGYKVGQGLFPIGLSEAEVGILAQGSRSAALGNTSAVDMAKFLPQVEELIKSRKSARATPSKLKTESLENATAKTIYAYGFKIGAKLAALGLSETDVSAISRGLIDAACGKNAAVDMELYLPKVAYLISAHVATAAETQKNKGAAFIKKFALEDGASPIIHTHGYIKILSPGDGPQPSTNNSVTVNYEGTLIDGTKFDSSYDRGSSATFPLSNVIPCWTNGVAMMRVGSRARLVCPSDAAYGDQGHPPMIPPAQRSSLQSSYSESLGAEA